MSTAPAATSVDSTHSGSPTSPHSLHSDHNNNELRHVRSVSSVHSSIGDAGSVSVGLLRWGPHSGPNGTPLTVHFVAQGPGASSLRKASIWFGAPARTGGQEVVGRLANDGGSHDVNAETRLTVTGFVPQLEGLRENGANGMYNEINGGEDMLVRVGVSIRGDGEHVAIELGEFQFATGSTGLAPSSSRSMAAPARRPAPIDFDSARSMSTPMPQGEFSGTATTAVFPGSAGYRRSSIADAPAVYARPELPLSPHVSNSWAAPPTGGSVHSGSPVREHARTRSTSSSSGQESSVTANGTHHRSTSSGAQLRHPPAEPRAGNQPSLLRTTQIQCSPGPNTGLPSPSSSMPSPSPRSGFPQYTNRAVLNLQGDLSTMAMGWTPDEWAARRRLVQFWRKQEGNVIDATFTPIAPHQFVPNSIVVSCIFREDRNECFITSVDTIYLLEALVGVRFTVEEKNRIRRNLEGFRPATVSKSKADSEPFFKLIMSFPNPKPRNIEKDVKVFQWKNLGSALQKILSKYSATYPSPGDRSVPPSALTETMSGNTTPATATSPQFSPVPPSLSTMTSHQTGPHRAPSEIGSNSSSPVVPSSEYGHRPGAYDLSGIMHQTHHHSHPSQSSIPQSPFSPASQLPVGYSAMDQSATAPRHHGYHVPYSPEVPAYPVPMAQNRSASESQWPTHSAGRNGGGTMPPPAPVYGGGVVPPPSQAPSSGFGTYEVSHGTTGTGGGAGNGGDVITSPVSSTYYSEDRRAQVYGGANNRHSGGGGWAPYHLANHGRGNGHDDRRTSALVESGRP